jgi:dTDP-4-amino-4,6-dideoxygalactose transaminase
MQPIMSQNENIPFVDLKTQYQGIKEEINEAIGAVLERSDFVLGQAVEEFENAFADYCQASHAVGVNSGYSAIELILRAYDIGPGDAVITAANTFIATVLPILNCGATPVLVDIDPDTYNLDPNLLEAAITPATRAIIPVHLYGQPADMDAIWAVANRHNLLVIEDACQAHGALYKGKRVGSLGHAAAFSFYPGKNLGAYGDGGAVVTDYPAIAEKVRILRNLGMPVKYHHEIRGFNNRLDTMQAAVLCVKLSRLDAWNEARRNVAQLYTEQLANSPVDTPRTAPWAEPVYHLYVVRSQAREDLQEHLQSAGIASGFHYPIPLHLQPALKDLGYRLGDFPITEKYANEIISLPMFPEMTEQQVDRVSREVKIFHSVAGEIAGESKFTGNGHSNGYSSKISSQLAGTPGD